MLIKTKIEGEHFIPLNEPIILVSNHISYLDGFALGYLARRRKRQVHFLAKEEIFKNPILKKVLLSAGQIPVARRTENAKDALRYAKQSLQNGHIVGIFPEATMPTDLVQLPIRTGAIRLSQDTQVPIVVIGMWGAHEIFRKGSKPRLKIRHKHAIVVTKGYIVDTEITLDKAREDLENRMKDATSKAIELRG